MIIVGRLGVGDHECVHSPMELKGAAVRGSDHRDAGHHSHQHTKGMAAAHVGVDQFDAVVTNPLGDSSQFKRASIKFRFNQIDRRVDMFLHAMQAYLWPERIIIGGGVSKKHERYFQWLETRAEIVPAQLLNEAGIIGAALAAEASP